MKTYTGRVAFISRYMSERHLGRCRVEGAISSKEDGRIVFRRFCANGDVGQTIGRAGVGAFGIFTALSTLTNVTIAHSGTAAVVTDLGIIQARMLTQGDKQEDEAAYADLVAVTSPTRRHDFASAMRSHGVVPA